MKIGIDLSFITFNNINFGLGLFAKQLIEGLIKEDNKHNYIIFVHKNFYLSAQNIFASERIKVISIAHSYSLNTNFQRPFKYFIQYFCFKNLLKKAKPDLFINIYLNCFSPLYDNKTINILHDLHFTYYPEVYSNLGVKWQKYRIGKLLSQGVINITISDYVKKDVLNLYHEMPQEKISVISNPVELDICNDYELQNNNKYILTVNSLVKWKNTITLLKSFKLIVKKMSYNLIIVGTGSEHDILQNFIKDNQLENRVIIKSEISTQALCILYKNASLFVNTSLFEGFGRSNIEAGLMKIPILSSEEMCLKEVSFGLLEYYSPAADEQILASRILECINKDVFSDERLENIKKRFILEYNKSAIAKEYLEVFNRV